VSDQFSLRRLGLLLRNDFKHGYRSWLIVSAALALLAFLTAFFNFPTHDVTAGLYRGFFIATLFTWGLIATSFAFRDLHGRSTNASYLLLPATALEKTAARLLIETVLFVVYLLLFTTVLSLAIEGMTAAAFDARFDPFSPFDRTAWLVLPHYVAVQACFFLGAAWFRRAHYIKTVLALAAIVAALATVGTVIAAALFMGGSWIPNGNFVSFDWVVELAAVGYYFVLPLFCWFVAWLRVQEAEVSHAI